jgi:uncharacterized protein (TIGR03067 family)
MNGLIRFAAVAAMLMIISTLAVENPQDDEAKKEVAKLNGTWQITKFIDPSGPPLPDNEFKDGTLEFKDGSLTIRKTKDDAGQTMTYSVDTSKEPKWIDVKTDRVKVKTVGIYKLDGDELTLCVVELNGENAKDARPTKFEANGAAKSALYVLKRAKP